MDISSLYPIPPGVSPDARGPYEGIRDAAQQFARTLVECCPEARLRTVALAQLGSVVATAYRALEEPAS